MKIIFSKVFFVTKRPFFFAESPTHQHLLVIKMMTKWIWVKRAIHARYEPSFSIFLQIIMIPHYSSHSELKDIFFLLQKAQPTSQHLLVIKMMTKWIWVKRAISSWITIISISTSWLINITKVRKEKPLSKLPVPKR